MSRSVVPMRAPFTMINPASKLEYCFVYTLHSTLRVPTLSWSI